MKALINPEWAAVYMSPAPDVDLTQPLQVSPLQSAASAIVVIEINENITYIPESGIAAFVPDEPIEIDWAALEGWYKKKTRQLNAEKQYTTELIKDLGGVIVIRQWRSDLGCFLAFRIPARFVISEANQWIPAPAEDCPACRRSIARHNASLKEAKIND